MQIEWLLANAAPVIRYRTHTELLNTCDDEFLLYAMAEILALPQTQKRLNLLKNLDYRKIHGSNSTFLENVLPMLSDFGLHYGIDAFKNLVVPDIILKKTLEKTHNGIFNYDRVIMCPFLLRSKFSVDGLLDAAIERIDTIYEFTRHMDYDIYDDATDYKSVPKAFWNRPIIKPSLSHGTMCKLPLIYDMVMLAEVYDSVPTEIKTKIDTIVNYVISPDYDVVVPMYGILCVAPRKYYAMGWDCKKPFNDNQNYSNPNLHRLLLYSNFPTAVKSAWFQNAIGYLTQYKTETGTYIFPKEYLPESDSNWVLGVRMSLGENSRKKSWIEIESTFYMFKLLNSIKLLAS